MTLGYIIYRCLPVQDSADGTLSLVEHMRTYLITLKEFVRPTVLEMHLLAYPEVVLLDFFEWFFKCDRHLRM